MERIANVKWVGDADGGCVEGGDVGVVLLSLGGWGWRILNVTVGYFIVCGVSVEEVMGGGEGRRMARCQILVLRVRFSMVVVFWMASWIELADIPREKKRKSPALCWEGGVRSVVEELGGEAGACKSGRRRETYRLRVMTK